MIYDYKTTNTSFLEVANELREKYNVRNNLFMLKLYDSKLQGVDPYDPAINSETKARIYRECKNNIRYFLRELSRIPTTGASAIPFKLSIANCAQMYLVEHNINYLMILPRQQGKTVGETAFIVWATLFGTENNNTIYMNKNFTQTKYNLKLFKDQRDSLPKWLVELVKAPDDTDNTENVIMKRNNNSINLMASATSKETADKAARGLTAAIIWADEIAFMNHNETIFAAFVPAWKTAAMNAEKNHAPYGIHLTTTPNDLDSPSGKWCYGEIYQKALRFREELYDIPEKDFKQYIMANSSNNYCLIEYSWQQLGLSETWYTEMCKDMLFNMLKIKRELLLEWPLSNENSVFSEEQLDEIKRFIHKPVFYMQILKREFMFYEKPDFNLNYILGEDVSGGVGSDRSVIIFLHPRDFHVVGLFMNSNISTFDFAELNKMLLNTYFRNAVIVIEYQSYGKAIIDNLVQNHYYADHIYGEMIEKRAEYGIVDGVAQRSNRKVFRYGVSTDAASRTKYMQDLLPAIVNDEFDKIISPELFSEIKTLEYSRRHHGKIEAAENCHDDVVFAMLIARYAIYYGTDMQTRFRINKIPSASNINTNSAHEQIEAANQFNRFISSMNSLDKDAAFNPTESRGKSAYDKMRKADDEQANDRDWLFK